MLIKCDFSNRLKATCSKITSTFVGLPEYIWLILFIFIYRFYFFWAFISGICPLIVIFKLCFKQCVLFYNVLFHVKYAILILDPLKSCLKWFKLLSLSFCYMTCNTYCMLLVVDLNCRAMTPSAGLFLSTVNSLGGPNPLTLRCIWNLARFGRFQSLKQTVMCAVLSGGVRLQIHCCVYKIFTIVAYLVLWHPNIVIIV